MRIKGGKSRDELFADVISGIVQLDELPNSVRSDIAGRIAAAEAEAKEKAEAKAAKKKGKK